MQDEWKNYWIVVYPYISHPSAKIIWVWSNRKDDIRYGMYKRDKDNRNFWLTLSEKFNDTEEYIQKQLQYFWDEHYYNKSLEDIEDYDANKNETKLHIWKDIKKEALDILIKKQSDFTINKMREIIQMIISTLSKE